MKTGMKTGHVSLGILVFGIWLAGATRIASAQVGTGWPVADRERAERQGRQRMRSGSISTARWYGRARIPAGRFFTRYGCYGTLGAGSARIELRKVKVFAGGRAE